MPYPLENPKAKHDFLIYSQDDLSEDPKAVFDKLDSPLDPSQMKLISTIYSYPDGPRHPGPISRSVPVIGFVDSSSKIAQKLCSDPPMHKCTIAVKKFDSRLPDKDKQNTASFAKFVTKLGRTDTVAILGKDKYNRFGILKPMVEENDEEEKFAAECFVGDIETAKSLFPEANGTSAADADTGTNWGADTGTSDDGAGLWQPPGVNQEDIGGGTSSNDGLWQPPGAGQEDTGGSLWKPPGSDQNNEIFNFASSEADNTWQPSMTGITAAGIDTFQSGLKRNADEMENGGKKGETEFHKNAGAAAADDFYSNLTRELDTRSESKLYHMRAFNGWVKAMQIQELNPQTMQQGKRKKGSAPMRVLDLACGKGGDLGKWILHPRKMSNYVGVDVARGSLKDAAKRARQRRHDLGRCTFTCADLGEDVPGRLKSPKKKQMQKLLSWSLQNESQFESAEPKFELVRGGGISQADKFDVVSIQFAIHYMMQTRKRARRFFRTVSELLEVGGNLIATTIDARVVIDHLMDLGEDLHFDSDDAQEQPDREIVVTVGAGACQIRFQRQIVKKIIKPPDKDSPGASDNVFGLEYTFTLREGSDHAAGVGQAVDLPEWLIPLPVLKSLAEEAGLELEYAQNFHEFFEIRKDPQSFPAAHLALYNMKVLNKNGSISEDEWEISRLYCAIKFKKVREAQSILEDDTDEESEDEEPEKEAVASGNQQEKKDAAIKKPDPKLLMKAMVHAKMAYGKDQWESLSSDEKKRLTQIELEKLVNQ